MSKMAAAGFSKRHNIIIELQTMKLAISGKGGVGKSTLAAALSLLMAKQGKRVLAVDADPDANLASALGMSSLQQDSIVPISKQAELIEQRTGAKVKQYGQMFKLNPEVSDIADNYAAHHQGVDLLVLGAVENGGGGCACPENVLLKALVTDLILRKDDALVMDMEAGVEHLGRATARGVDAMIIVVEPGQRSIDCARRVIRMATQIGIKKLCFIANKVTSSSDEKFIEDALEGYQLTGSIKYSEKIRNADMKGYSILECGDDEVISGFVKILETLEKEIGND